MKRIENLAEKFRNIKRVLYLEEVIVSHMSHIKSIRCEDFIDIIEFYRESYKDQVEDFDEFFKYVMSVMLENGFEVGNLTEGSQINKFPDGSVIDYNWDKEKKAEMIISNWNKSLEMFPFETYRDDNYSILVKNLSVISPLVAQELKLREIVVKEDLEEEDK